MLFKVPTPLIWSLKPYGLVKVDELLLMMTLSFPHLEQKRDKQCIKALGVRSVTSSKGTAHEAVHVNRHTQVFFMLSPFSVFISNGPQ